MTTRQEQRNIRAQELMNYAVGERLCQIRRMTAFEREGIDIRLDLIAMCFSILYVNAYTVGEIGSLWEQRNSLIDRALASSGAPGLSGNAQM